MEPDRLIHHYCAYHRDSRLEFGWVRALQKNKLVVQPVLGREQFLPTNRILWSQPSQQIAEGGALQQLTRILEEAEGLAAQIDLPTIHDLVEPGAELTLMMRSLKIFWKNQKCWLTRWLCCWRCRIRKTGFAATARTPTHP